MDCVVSLRCFMFVMTLKQYVVKLYTLFVVQLVLSLWQQAVYQSIEVLQHCGVLKTLQAVPYINLNYNHTFVVKLKWAYSYLFMRLISYPIVGKVSSHIIYYPTQNSLANSNSFGSMLGICLIIQIIIGLFLAMHYIPNVQYAFSSIQYITRDVNYG